MFTIQVHYSNAAALIIPIVQTLLGAAYVVYSCAFVIVQLVLLWIHASACLQGVARLYLLHISLPAPITSTLSSVGNMIGPMRMLLAGMAIAEVPLKKFFCTPRNYLPVFLRLLGVPLALDELQSLSMKAEYLSRMTYMLGNGIGKMRGNRVGGTQRMQTWCNTILSTGEQPITVESSMDGENTRVMELYASPIEDTDFARKVHQTVEENYGFAGQEFVNYLFREFDMEKGVEKLRKEYAKFREEFITSYEMLYEKCTSIYLEFVAFLVFADYISSKAVFKKEE